MLIFHHIVKTAGSSLLGMLRHNYQPHELLEVYGPNRYTVDWYQNFYRSLTPTEKATVKCIAAHSAHFIIPVLEKSRQAFRVFCLLRDPIERAISLYNYTQSIIDTGNGRGAEMGKTIKQLSWKIEDIYLNLGEGDESSSPLHELFKHFFNGQTRTILAPHIPTQGIRYVSRKSSSDDEYKDIQKAILDHYYTIGVQEHYKKSIDQFSKIFEWKNVIYLQENVTQSRPKINEIPEDVKDLISRYNYLDVELHDTYMKKFDSLM